MKMSDANNLILSNRLFFEEITKLIHQGKNVAINPRGNSMRPLVHPHTDKILLQPLNEKSFEKGNIVLAKTKYGKYVVHRIEKIQENTIILRGDGNPYGREKCPKENIVAEVTAIYKKNRKITKDSFWWNVTKNYWSHNALIRKICLAIYK